MTLFNQLIPTFQNLRPSRSSDEAERETFLTPVYEVKEADDAYGLEVFVPGAVKDAIELQVDQDELVITARRAWTAPKDWTPVFRETADADFRLRLDLNESVDVDKINAELEQGVLRVTLPKVEAHKPRKIEIA